jgi:predicted MPP superfamily phosphohydrolase
MAISRRALVKSMFAACVGAMGGTGAYGFLYGRNALELTRATIPLDALPPALDGLRIALITDIHRSEWVSDDDVADAVNLVMSSQPELVVLGGDYVSFADRTYVGPVAEALGMLSAPLGVYAILGNHDDDRAMPAALSARGVRVLKDARTQLSIRNETLELAGIDFWTKRFEDIRAVTKGAKGPIILLAHDPRRLVEAEALNIPLVLSGHTHGGQVVLPVVGPIAARKFPIVDGIGRSGPTTLFVSRGVGTVYVPIRLNCPPEVTLLTLQSTSKDVV